MNEKEKEFMLSIVEDFNNVKFNKLNDEGKKLYSVSEDMVSLINVLIEENKKLKGLV